MGSDRAWDPSRAPTPRVGFAPGIFLCPSALPDQIKPMPKLIELTQRTYAQNIGRFSAGSGSGNGQTGLIMSTSSQQGLGQSRSTYVNRSPESTDCRSAAHRNHPKIITRNGRKNLRADQTRLRPRPTGPGQAGLAIYTRRVVSITRIQVQSLGASEATSFSKRGLPRSGSQIGWSFNSP